MEHTVIEKLPLHVFVDAALATGYKLDGNLHKTPENMGKPRQAADAKLFLN